jgi:hypothetical protein
MYFAAADALLEQGWLRSQMCRWPLLILCREFRGTILLSCSRTSPHLLLGMRSTDYLSVIPNARPASAVTVTLSSIPHSSPFPELSAERPDRIEVMSVKCHFLNNTCVKVSQSGSPMKFYESLCKNICRRLMTPGASGPGPSDWPFASSLYESTTT